MDSDFRTNVGIVNLDTTSHTFLLTLTGERKSATLYAARVDTTTGQRKVAPPSMLFDSPPERSSLAHSVVITNPDSSGDFNGSLRSTDGQTSPSSFIDCSAVEGQPRSAVPFPGR